MISLDVTTLVFFGVFVFVSGIVLGGLVTAIETANIRKRYDRVLRDRSFWEEERAYIKKEIEPDGFLPYTDWTP